MRSLRDLYVRGKEVTLDDGSDDPVTVWVQKLNPIEQESALRKADAARARSLAVLKNKDSDEYQAILSDVLATDDDVLIDILATLEHGRVLPIARAEVADRSEWKAENYLVGLQETWDDGMQERFVDDPEDEEAARVHAELQKFFKEVDEIADDRVELFRDGLESMPYEERCELAVGHHTKVAANVAWINEYNRQAIFFAVRDGVDKKARVFESRAEVDELQGEVLVPLKEAIERLTVDQQEGKDLAAQLPSSNSSEPSAPEATEPSSGPTDVAA